MVGTLESTPSTRFTLEFYTGTTFQHTDGTEADDAEQFILTETLTTNASGIAFFDSPFTDGSVTAGTIVRATATDPAGNTSEFSNAMDVETDSDNDGIPDNDEDVNGGDANNDGKPDSQEPNVVTIPDALNSNSFVTLVAPAGLSFTSVRPLVNPSPDDAPAQTQFGLGFFDFTIVGLTPGQHVAIQMTLPVTVSPANTYWRYGLTPDNPSEHWFEWNYNAQTDTGAEINGNTITLHFVDGASGDEDLTANGVILDAGGPGFADPFTVTTTADSGIGSLRQAILNADANPGDVEITFDIPGPGPFTIKPLSPLPAITDSVTVDGLRQPPSQAGYDVEGTTPLIELDGSLAGSATDGLVVSGGTVTIEGLVINRFGGDGIHVETRGAAQIETDFIGTDSSGTVALGNGSFGVEIENNTANNDDDEEDSGSTPSDISGDVISGNLTGGVFIHGVGAVDNSLTNNLIGTQADGVGSLANLGPGVLLNDGSTSTSIGSGLTDQSNTIAYNRGAGVEVLDSQGNLIRANSIFANGGLGIDLGGDGVTPDSPDAPQNFPVITQVASYGGYTDLSGTLNSEPESYFVLDFYTSATHDPSGFGPGQTYLGSTTVTTDENGQADFDVSLMASVAAGSFITATSSVGGSFTSEFSAAIQLPASQALVFTVNTNDDINDAVPVLAHFSLREAILAANNHPGQDIIRFDLPDDERIITPLSPLPAITDAVIIDGTSQPGYQGLPLVELDGSEAGAGASGLEIKGSGSIVRGLVINRFQDGITLDGLGGNTIEENFLGTDVTGTNAFLGEQAGVLVNNSPNNLIGGTTAADRNVILTVFLEGDNATGNQVEGNDIDTDLTGTVLLLGSGASGVLIEEATANSIGGTAAGAGNLIGGGVTIFSGQADVVQGNLIGTDKTGTDFLSFGPGTGLPGGVYLDLHSNDNTIGGTTAAAHNIIPGGLEIDGNGNQVQGNYVGTDLTGTVALTGLTDFASGDDGDGNGILVGGSYNEIGGVTPGAGNLISGNSGSGVVFSGIGNSLLGNLIGTDVTGTKPLGNQTGVTVSASGYDNQIGGSYPGEGNVISGNIEYGVFLKGFTGDVVAGNFIGTDRTGTLALGNGLVYTGFGGGVYVSEPNVVIGGSQPGAGNVISGNGGNGITIDSDESPASGIAIQGNDIGTDVTGTSRLGNSGDGIYINASPNNGIGGEFPGAGNVISANGGDGVRIVDFPGEGDESTGNMIDGNKIGTDVTGALDLGNGGDGVSIIESSYTVSNETVGGTIPGAGNVIAFNAGPGVSALFSSGNAIRGNDIFANGGPASSMI